MRRPFAVVTILAVLAAVVLGASKREPMYFAKLGAADLVGGRFPREYLASGLYDANMAPGISYYLKEQGDKAPAAVRLAYAEMLGAAIVGDGDENLVAAAYEKLIEDYPESPLIHYRYAAFLLSRLQEVLRWREVDAEEGRIRLMDLAGRARSELIASYRKDPYNSIIGFEMAYSFWALGDVESAIEWLGRAVEAPEFDTGDDVVLGGSAKLMIDSGAPALEGLVAAYHVCRHAPSRLATRMESMVASLLSDRVRLRHLVSHDDFMDFLIGFEDLSAKLMETASVMRQSQSALVTSGLLWHKVSAEAVLRGDSGLEEMARTQLARASYRYLVLGEERLVHGLPAQQGILELDVPVELRLPFSGYAQKLAGALAIFVVVVGVPAVLFGIAAIKVKGVRQLAISLAVLGVFALLGYCASFYSTSSERSRVTRNLSARVRLLRSAPAAMRGIGDLANRRDYDPRIARRMLNVYNYTLQAGRVLAYIGTRDCLESLIEALDHPEKARPSELIHVLREETGLDFGFDARHSRAANLQALAAWKNWWQSAQSSYPETLEAAPAAGDTSAG